jgi:phospholipid transport system transporter-binding protein
MISFHADCIRFSGPVTVATVTTLLAEGEKMVRGGARSLDFSAVTEIDSAAVSLVLHLQRVAVASGAPGSVSLRLQSLPEAMTNLAGLYGVQELLQPA